MSKLKKRKKYSGNNTEFYEIERAQPVYQSKGSFNDNNQRREHSYTAGGTPPTNTSKPSNSGSSNPKINPPGVGGRIDKYA